jgi:hypothetical protein
MCVRACVRACAPMSLSPRSMRANMCVRAVRAVGGVRSGSVVCVGKRLCVTWSAGLVAVGAAIELIRPKPGKRARAQLAIIQDARVAHAACGAQHNVRMAAAHRTATERCRMQCTEYATRNSRRVESCAVHVARVGGAHFVSHALHATQHTAHSSAEPARCVCVCVCVCVCLCVCVCVCVCVWHCALTHVRISNLL